MEKQTETDDESATDEPTRPVNKCKLQKIRPF